MYDAIIIGAGMSGLAAGIRLAHFGQRVCILERHYAIGGLNSYYRLDGRNYDVGLHAVTNFQPKGAKRGPLPRLLRQLRFAWEDFELAPQVGSQIAFPGVSLEFNNDAALLAAEIAAKFPRQADNFRRLQAAILDYDALETPVAAASAREMVGREISDPLLVEMLFCPLMYYGSARERDMDWGQFGIMFRSIYLEGFARPLAGVRLILKKLVRRFKELGGELRLRAGVKRLATEGGRVSQLILDDGEELSARRILSSVGWCETLRLCDGSVPTPPAAESGQLSFIESISTLDVQPSEVGYRHTIVFFNDTENFHWERPDDLADIRSGVICSPNNFCYQPTAAAAANSPLSPGGRGAGPAVSLSNRGEGALPEGAMRITALANFNRWSTLDETAYAAQKRTWYDRMVASAVRFVPDFRPHVVATDLFTPTTIRRFTGHDNGAVYGAPRKHHDGTTPLENLFLCGTDQGFVGIIGALTSGIAMANRHFLAANG